MSWVPQKTTALLSVVRESKQQVPSTKNAITYLSSLESTFEKICKDCYVVNKGNWHMTAPPVFNPKSARKSPLQTLSAALVQLSSRSVSLVAIALGTTTYNFSPVITSETS